MKEIEGPYTTSNSIYTPEEYLQMILEVVSRAYKSLYEMEEYPERLNEFSREFKWQNGGANDKVSRSAFDRK